MRFTYGAPDFAELFPTETDGRTDRHAVFLDTIHGAQMCVHVTVEWPQAYTPTAHVALRNVTVAAGTYLLNMRECNIDSSHRWRQHIVVS